MDSALSDYFHVVHGHLGGKVDDLPAEMEWKFTYRCPLPAQMLSSSAFWTVLPAKVDFSSIWVNARFSGVIVIKTHRCEDA